MKVSVRPKVVIGRTRRYPSAVTKPLLFLVFCLGLVGSPIHGEEPLLPVIKPEEASQHEGKLVTVHGVVDGQRDSKKGITYLNFGGRFPNQVFTCLLKAKNFPEGAPALEGKTVEVTGLIHMYEGKPSMDLRGSESIKILEEDPKTKP